MKPEGYARILFLFVFIWLGAATFILIQNGYVNDTLLKEIGTYLIFSTHDSAIQMTGFLPINLPMLGYRIIGPFFGSFHAIIPYTMGIISIALFIWLTGSALIRHLGVAGTLLFTVCLCLNPIILWAATANGGKILSLLPFYGMCVFLCRIHDRHDLDSYMKFGLSTVLFLLSDSSSIFISIALLPWLCLAGQRSLIIKNPLTYYLATLTPIIMTIGALIYLNWTALGRFSPFIVPISHNAGHDFSWNSTLLQASFSYRIKQTVLFFFYMTLFFPALIVFLILSGRKLYLPWLAILLTLGLSPLIVMICNLPYHPLDYLPYSIAPLLILAQRIPSEKRLLLLATQMFSVALGWIILAQPGWVSEGGWTDALLGKKLDLYHDEIQIGKWIAQQKQTVLLDPLAQYRVVAFSGDTRRLVFPQNGDGMIVKWLPPSDYLLVSMSDTKEGPADRIRHTHPTVWALGLPHNHLAHEEGAYRIWDRDR